MKSTRKALLLALVLSTLSPSLALAKGGQEKFGCALIDGLGRARAAVSFTLRTEGREVVGIDFSQHLFSADSFIYRRADGAFMGDSVPIAPPAYLPFEEWRRQCLQIPLVECDEEHYLKDKAAFEATAPRFRLAYEIPENDPEYRVLSSKVDSRLDGSALMRKAPENTTVPGMIRFESDISTAPARVFVTNELESDRLFLQWTARFRLTLDNGEISYILNVDQYVGDAAIRRSYACPKR